MNGNRASGLKKGYSGPSLHGGNTLDQKGIAMTGDLRQASHTISKTVMEWTSAMLILPLWRPNQASREKLHAC